MWWKLQHADKLNFTSSWICCQTFVANSSTFFCWCLKSLSSQTSVAVVVVAEKHNFASTDFTIKVSCHHWYWTVIKHFELDQFELITADDCNIFYQSTIFQMKKFTVRPYSHETFWRTILRYCDKKIFLSNGLQD